MHSSPLGGGNAPFHCLPNKHHEEDDLGTFIVKETGSVDIAGVVTDGDTGTRNTDPRSPVLRHIER